MVEKVREVFMTPIPPQPNTGDERLREKIAEILSKHPRPIYVGDMPTNLYVDDVSDSIMQAVKAELGAAQHMHEFSEDNYACKFCKLTLRELADNTTELRNHFGIGEKQA